MKSWDRISPPTIKNCFLSVGTFCEAGNDDELKILETLENVS